MARDAVKVVVCDAHDNVLVLRRSDTHPHWPLEVDFPGGDVDDNETVIEAVLRELREETGLCSDTSQLEFVESWPNHYGSQHHLYRLSLSEHQPTVTVSWEHASHSWLPRAVVAKQVIPARTDRFNTSIVQYLLSGE